MSKMCLCLFLYQLLYHWVKETEKAFVSFHSSTPEWLGVGDTSFFLQLGVVFHFFLFSFLNFLSMITHLQETWKISTKLHIASPYSTVIF